MAPRPLFAADEIDTDDVEAYLREIGDVFVVQRGHDSHNTSAGVTVDGGRWFVGWTTTAAAT